MRTKDTPRPLGELFPHGPKTAAEFQPLCLLSMQEEGEGQRLLPSDLKLF